MISGRWDKPELQGPSGLLEVCVSHHCASVPPVRPGSGVAAGRRRAGMGIQAAVAPCGASVAGGPGASVADRAGKSGRIIQAWSGGSLLFSGASSTYADNTGNAWIVNLNNGNVNNDNKTNTNRVWPVRSGEWWFHRPVFSAARWSHV